MPPRGVELGTKRARQHEHIKVTGPTRRYGRVLVSGKLDSGISGKRQRSHERRALDTVSDICPPALGD